MPRCKNNYLPNYTTGLFIMKLSFQRDCIHCQWIRLPNLIKIPHARSIINISIKLLSKVEILTVSNCTNIDIK